ncbi:MAG: hypothetical protein IJR99_14340 [Kiritimatiellae bacterium]|nr:hypothetical protein [Kiritimatiellia bacterium]
MRNGEVSVTGFLRRQAFALAILTCAVSAYLSLRMGTKQNEAAGVPLPRKPTARAPSLRSGREARPWVREKTSDVRHATCGIRDMRRVPVPPLG